MADEPTGNEPEIEADMALLGYTPSGTAVFQIAGADGADDDKGGKDDPDGGKGGKDDDPDDGGDDAPDPEAEAKKWKALSRKHEAQAKANAEAAKRLQELEDEKKSAEQKAADKASKAEKDRDDARLEAARLKVALKKGLTETQAKRLVGSTEEELEADADELLESFKSDDDEESGKDERKRRPKEKLKSGAVSNTEKDDPDDYREHAKKLPRY